MDQIEAAFSRIYEQNLWANGSGTGSRPEANGAYMRFIANFMLLNDVRSVVDLGCGDWQFSRLIDWSGVHYTGIDVVPSVIAQNQAAFGREGVTFRTAGEISAIPPADLLICKDVLQHLPNAVVEAYLKALRGRYRWLLITNDDWPDETLNADIQPGGWRALRLDQPPFSVDAVSLMAWTVISETPTVRKRTVLIRGEGSGLSYAAAAGSPRGGALPRRIYQTWKVRAPLPGPFAHWSESFRRHNPDFEHVIWDNADNRAFIAEHYPWFLPNYDGYEQEILRVDAVRYFVMFHFGGFYFDLDVQCLAPLDRYLDGHDVILGQLGPDPAFDHAVPNSAMASRRGQSFWLFVISRLLEDDPRLRVEYRTGPVFLKRCLDAWNRGSPDCQRAVDDVRARLSPGALVEDTGSVTLLPPGEWQPLNWADRLHLKVRDQLLFDQTIPLDEAPSLFPEAVVVNYWTHTWDLEDQRTLRPLEARAPEKP